MSYIKSGRGRGRGRGSESLSRPQQQQQPQRSQLAPSEFPELGQPQPAVAPPPPRSAWGKPIQPQPAPTPIPASTPTPKPQQQISVTQSVLVSESTFATSFATETITKEMASVKIESTESVSPFETPHKESLDSRENSPDKSLTVRVLNGEFPAKRERGDLGRVIKLRANHYSMRLKKEYILYQYDVEVKRKNEPKVAAKKEVKLIKNKRLMREIFLHLMNKILGAEYKNKVIYNFSKNLYSLKKFPFEINVIYEIKIDNSEFILQIQPTKNSDVIRIDPRNLDDPATIQVLDLIMTLNLNYSCVNLNRSFFTDPCEFKELGFGLELWKGAYTSVRPCEVGLTWNLDTAHAAFLTSKDLLEVVMQHYNCNFDRIDYQIKNDKHPREKAIIGASFLDAYKGRDIKTATGGYRKKIQGFGPDAFYKFKWNKGNTSIDVSIKDYLREHYNINLKYPHLPCVDLGKGSYLPMELCKTELSHKKNLDERQTADMIKHTAVSAPKRESDINKWAKASQIDKDPVLGEYNINVDLRMIEMDGRILDAPDIKYDTNIVKSNIIGTKGSWNHNRFKFANSFQINRWIILNFTRIYDDNLKQFAQKFAQVGNDHGMRIAPCLEYKSFQRPNDNQVRNLFDEMFIKHKPLDLVVCVFFGTTTAYKVVKTAGDLQYGVPTQCVEEKNVTRLNDQTISNILLKVNTKLGGRNFMLSRQTILFTRHLNELYQGPLMIFGADVSHPSPDSKLTESLAAVVGSLDADCSFYAARLYAQSTPRGQAYELIHDLDKMVNSLLRAHFEKNKSYPKKIVFYRDGVSEGQFSLVLRHEMNKIRTACQNISSGYKPAITFVVVQKRHHTRLFPLNKQDAHGRAENVPPGTIVDTTIVTAKMVDFFLCSHSGIQGTSRPCHYYVLHDDNDFKTNQIQLLSHYLCHIYSRCPRSVSYPAPAYYAHLAAFRARDYIRKPPSEVSNNKISSYEIELHQNIRNKMFFC